MSVWRFYLIPNGQKGLWRENFFVEKLLSLIIFMRNEIRRAIYSTDYIKSISIYFLSSSIGIMRQIYNHIQIEEYRCPRQMIIYNIYYDIHIKITNKVKSFGE